MESQGNNYPKTIGDPDNQDLEEFHFVVSEYDSPSSETCLELGSVFVYAPSRKEAWSIMDFEFPNEVYALEEIR